MNERNRKIPFKVMSTSIVLSTGILFGGNYMPFNFAEPVSVEAAAISYKTTANLNMRAAASTKGKVLTTIPKGKKVTYVSKSGSWYKVKYGTKTGFVSSKYVTKINEATTTAISATKYQTTTNLNIRQKATTSSSILKTIPKGKVVTATAKSGSWYKITYGGKTGWISSKYVKEYYKYSATSKTYYNSKATASLYSTPDTKKSAVLSITKNNSFESTQKIVNSKSETWYRVSYKGKNYYIKASSVSKVTPATITKTDYTIKTATKLYAFAGDKHQAVIAIPKGTAVSSTYRLGNWYRVVYNGKTGWVSGSFITKVTTTSSTSNTNTNTNSSKPAGKTITKTSYETIADLNIRTSNSSSSEKLGQIPEGTTVTSVYKANNGWYEVTYKNVTGYVSGTYLITADTASKINSLESNKNSYLFMDLRTTSSVTASQINNYIALNATASNSVLYGKGQVFVDAAKKYGVNALYLAAHAIHESNYGKSTISLAKNNLFGYGSYDSAPFISSVRFSSIQQGIEYIAKKMKATYLQPGYQYHDGAILGYTVKDANGIRINSLSKGMNTYYASDSGWGEKIAKHMEKMLSYSKEKAVSQSPNVTYPTNDSYPDLKDTFPTDTIAVAKTSLNVYTTNGNKTTVAATISKGKTFKVLEKWNNFWLKVEYNGKTYYTNDVSFSGYSNYISIRNLGRVTTANLNVRSSAGVSGSIVGKLSNYEYVAIAVDSKNNPVKENGWYKVIYNEKEAWVSDDYISLDLY